VLEITPNDETAYYNRGVSYGILGNHKMALNDYSQAIKINSKYAEAYYQRAISLINVNGFKAGKPDCLVAKNLGFAPAAQMFNMYYKGQ